jgi:hypothetical protein
MGTPWSEDHVSELQAAQAPKTMHASNPWHNAKRSQAHCQQNSLLK